MVHLHIYQHHSTILEQLRDCLFTNAVILQHLGIIVQQKKVKQMTIHCDNPLYKHVELLYHGTSPFTDNTSPLRWSYFLASLTHIAIDMVA